MIGVGMAVQAGPGYAINQAIDSAMRQEMIQDYGKKIIQDGTVHENPPGSAQPFYEAERQQMASQLQLISTNEDTGYRIVPGDTLTISWHDRDRIDRAAYKVSGQGEIFLPLVNAVKMAGLNRKEARERVDMVLKEYIRDPQTVIGVNTDGRVMIFGAVGLPGIYQVRNNLTVMEAILSAAGFNQKTAELASVIVIRGPVEKPEILKLNLKKMVQRGDRTDDIMVKPGDFIYIPTSFIANLEKFWNTTYGLLMQWYGLGGSPPIDGRHFNW